MLAWSEGTIKVKDSDNGYNVIVGGTLFHDYNDHPQKLVQLNAKLASTAAGRYQLLGRFWKVYKKQLGLKDFGPDAQDAVALQQINECKALPDIDNGNIETAIRKCARIWASLPGAGYGQHENSLDQLVTVWKGCGGKSSK